MTAKKTQRKMLPRAKRRAKPWQDVHPIPGQVAGSWELEAWLSSGSKNEGGELACLSGPHHGSPPFLLGARHRRAERPRSRAMTLAYEDCKRPDVHLHRRMTVTDPLFAETPEAGCASPSAA